MTGDDRQGPDARAAILEDKHHDAPSVFSASGLLREARRQKGLAPSNVPRVCVLDPDGDIVRALRAAGRATLDAGWACYHTELFRAAAGGVELGLIGCAVGAPFAVLLAEELFASGCELLVSVTSAGQLVPLRPPPYYVLIDRALRDEGTSYHYAPPAPFSHAPRELLAALEGAFDGLREPVVRGGTWTTDAPFRETEEAIARRRAQGLLAVEMEAAALYAFAEKAQRKVVCFAHVTNQMAQIEGDFEKGEGDGSVGSLALVAAVARRLGFGAR